MNIEITLPLNVDIFPPPLIRHAAGGLTHDQVRELFPNVSARLTELAHHALSTWVEKITKLPGRTGRPLQPRHAFSQHEGGHGVPH